ncbi:hypothetical protein SAMN04487896_1537 [Paenibacillus sp. ov031]|nr:hypothetical protein SAMN04487896_1537 [Paenibacillus sp. ov031]
MILNQTILSYSSSCMAYLQILQGNLIFNDEVNNEELYKNVKPYESLLPKHTMDFLIEAFEVLNTKKNSSLKD